MKPRESNVLDATKVKIAAELSTTRKGAKKYWLIILTYDTSSLLLTNQIRAQFQKIEQQLIQQSEEIFAYLQTTKVHRTPTNKFINYN